MKIITVLVRLWRGCAVSSAARVAGVGAALLLSVAGVAGASESEDAAILNRGPAVRGGVPPSVAVMFSGELMGWTEPCG